ncbi:MAG: hypothetical protein JF590_03115 [Gemmatimonadetes bacterium]|nr:hypothetical protein [Gemmatimonadota bacterium]
MPFPNSPSIRETIEKHFRRRGLAWTEQYFVEILETATRRHDVYWATIALRDCGSPACVPALKAKLDYPMQDVKCTAMLTIAHIARATETPFYAESLIGTAYREKGYAMWAIEDAADERAVDAVLQYFKKQRSKLRAGRLVNGTLAPGLQFLEAHREGREEIGAFFAEIAAQWAALPSGERREIHRRTLSFAHLGSAATA